MNKDKIELGGQIIAMNSKLDALLAGLKQFRSGIGSGAKFLSRAEVMEMLGGISPTTLATWTKEGMLKSYTVKGRVLYKQDEVIEAIIGMAA